MQTGVRYRGLARATVDADRDLWHLAQGPGTVIQPGSHPVQVRSGAEPMANSNLCGGLGRVISGGCGGVSR
jgi:hypothetical protein